MDQGPAPEPVPREQPPAPSRPAEPPVRFFKAVTQMLLGAGTVVVVVVQVIRALAAGHTLLDVHHEVFALIGTALTLAAVVELAYTLYSQNPDEALDPLVLGISGALLFQLGSTDALDVRESVAAALYVGTLAGLAAIRKHLSRTHPPNEETIREGWQQLQHWDQQRRRPRPRNNGRTQTKEGKHAVSQAAEEATADLEDTNQLTGRRVTDNS